MWFFHVCTLFYKMSFPNLSQKGKKVQLLVHIILTLIGRFVGMSTSTILLYSLIAGFIIPLPAVLTVLLSDKYRYNIGYFPPHLVACVPSDLSLWFFTLILPLDILAGAGLLMLIAIGWLLHKVKQTVRVLSLNSRQSLHANKVSIIYFKPDPLIFILVSKDLETKQE